MSGSEWADWIIKISTLIGSLSFIIKSFLKGYDKLIVEPDRRMAEKIQRENTEAIKTSIEPLTQAIELLNTNLKDSQADRKRIHIQLNDHEHRIVSIERRNLEHDSKKQIL